MRGILGFIVGLYVIVALIVGGAGAYRFYIDKSPPPTCEAPRELAIATEATELEGAPNVPMYLLYRAGAWPLAYFQEQAKADGIVDWLMIGFDPFTDCRS